MPTKGTTPHLTPPHHTTPHHTTHHPPHLPSQLFSAENQVLGDIMFCVVIAAVFKVVYCVMLINKSKAASKVITDGAVGTVGKPTETA